jgi:AcrR family transcriptional regulator
VQHVRAVTLTAIANRANIHVSAVRQYFESREAILLALAEQGYADWTSRPLLRHHVLLGAAGRIGFGKITTKAFIGCNTQASFMDNGKYPS